MLKAKEKERDKATNIETENDLPEVGAAKKQPYKLKPHLLATNGDCYHAITPQKRSNSV